MIRAWTAQILAVIRLEMRKTFFARRGLWVYLLAFAPVLLFVTHAILAPREQERLTRMASKHSAPTAALRSIHTGMSEDEVTKKVGEPFSERSGRGPNRGNQRRPRLLLYRWQIAIHLPLLQRKLKAHRRFCAANLGQRFINICDQFPNLLPAPGNFLRLRWHFRELFPR